MKVKLKVIAPAGVYLPKYGTRQQGGVFEVTQEEAGELLATPNTFELVGQDKPKKEKSENG